MRLPAWHKAVCQPRLDVPFLAVWFSPVLAVALSTLSPLVGWVGGCATSFEVNSVGQAAVGVWVAVRELQRVLLSCCHCCGREQLSCVGVLPRWVTAAGRSACWQPLFAACHVLLQQVQQVQQDQIRTAQSHCAPVASAWQSWGRAVFVACVAGHTARLGWAAAELHLCLREAVHGTGCLCAAAVARVARHGGAGARHKCIALVHV
jgi:hypothetical protein